MRQCGKRIQRKNYHLGLKWNNKPPPPPLWSAYTAVNIYFTLGQAQVYNISDHCMMAILVGRDFELLTPSDC